MSDETRPESPQVNPSGVTTNPEGVEHGSNALGHASGAFPDVRLLPDGRVAWRIPLESLPGDLEWLSTRQARKDHPHRPWWFRAEELPLADAQRMVPLGPLLELVANLRRRSEERAAAPIRSADPYRMWQSAKSEGSAETWADAADDLCALLSSLLGETTTGEGS